MAAAADTVKKVFLELGGKSAFVVLEDADLAAACGTAAFMICTHAGQGCAITTRLLVPRARLAEVLETTSATLASLAPGDPNDAGTICGPLISQRQRERVEGYLRLAVQEGGSFVVGGGRPPDRQQGWYVEPTLITGLDNSARVAREEIFGPVLAVIPYDGEQNALDLANDSPYGLSGSVWSTDSERAMNFARQMRTGTVSVNGGVWYSPDMPFGGYKQSGIGREMGAAGIAEYTETKSIAASA
jgi:aldehyde dehydrogenase (NAD+)